MEEQLPANQEKKISYDATYDTGYGTKIVTVAKEEFIIHETNNLHYLIDAFLRKEAHMEPRDFLEKVYFETFASPHGNVMEEAVSKFFGSKSKLAHKVRQICTERNLERAARRKVRDQTDKGLAVNPNDYAMMHPDKAKSDLRDYYFSKVFDMISPTASSIDPNFDVNQFCR